MSIFDIFKKHNASTVPSTTDVNSDVSGGTEAVTVTKPAALPDSLLDELRQTTVYTLKDKADAKRAEVAEDLFSWDERPDIVAGVLDDISQGLREIAATGKGRATITFLCHSDIISKFNGQHITSGFKVETTSNSVYPRIEVVGCNFVRADGHDAFDTDDHAFAIVDQLKDIVREHLAEKGFAFEKGWNNDINVSWITDATIDKIEEVLEIPGGWEALEKGVPLDDVLA